MKTDDKKQRPGKSLTQAAPSAADASCKLDVLLHDGDTFCVNGAQVCILEQMYHVRLGRLLQRLERLALEAVQAGYAGARVEMCAVGVACGNLSYLGTSLARRSPVAVFTRGCIPYQSHKGQFRNQKVGRLLILSDVLERLDARLPAALARRRSGIASYGEH